MATTRYLTEAERAYIVTALRRDAVSFGKLADTNRHLPRMKEQFVKQRSDCEHLADDIEQAEDIELG